MGERSRASQLPGTVSEQTRFILVALGTAVDQLAWKNNTGATVKITGAGVIFDAAVTGADTNNFAIGIVNKELAGSGSVAVTSVTTYASGTDAVAFVEEPLTLSGTAANLLIADGEVVVMSKTENGSGLEMPAGLVVLRFQYV